LESFDLAIRQTCGGACVLRIRIRIFWTTFCGPGITVRFTDQSSGQITSWRWSLGDGTVVEGAGAEARDFTHTYRTPNSSGYTVVLALKWPGGKPVIEEKSGVVTILSCSEAANTELSEAKKAIQGCLDAAGKKVLDAPATGWDGSRGKATAGGGSTDAADYLRVWKYFKAMYEVDERGNIAILRAPPVSLTVLPASAGPLAGAELRPIQPIIPRGTPTLTQAITAAALLILVLVAALVFLLRHRNSLSLGQPHQLPPQVRALREIDELQAEGLYERGAVKEFYRRFTGILRRYLEVLKGFPAPGCTAEEIAEHLPGEEDGRLAHLLKWADLVKFAGLEPTPARKDEDVKTAVSYIERTGLARTEDHGPVAPGC
jgi:hypothetical protein